MLPTDLHIRPATIEDAGAILEIYKPYILNTAITFEYTVPSIEEYTARILVVLNNYPFFVCEEGSKVIGYANATEFRKKAAYQWDFETSVYVAEEFQRNGIASLLYKKLLLECKERGFHNAYAGISIPNHKSVNFHLKLGFTEVGVFKNCGYKHGEWHSVLFMEKNLIPNEGVPNDIIKHKR